MQREKICRSAIRGLVIVRRSTNLVFSIGIGQRASQSMVMLLIPLWILRMHGSPFAIGVDVAAVSVAPMFFAIPIGAAADRLGSRHVVLIGAVSAAAATMLSISVSNVWLFGFWQMLAGLGRSAAWIGAQTSVTRERDLGNRRNQRIGLLSLSAQVGNFGGPFLAGVLISRANITAAFVVAAASIGAVAFSVPVRGAPAASVLRTGSSAAEEASAIASRHFGRAFRLLGLPTFRLIIVGSVVRLGLIAIRNSFYVVYLHHLGWSPLNIGIVLSLGSAASAGAAAMTGLLHRNFDTGQLLYVSLFGMALAFSAVPFFESFPAQLACMIVFGLGNGLSQTSLISLLAKATPRQDQGLAVGLRTSVNRAVQVSAPLLFGSLVTFVVLPTLLFALGMASLASLIGAAWLMRGSAQTSPDLNL
ncbi:MAG: MFS transporter [Actinomycetota bacterium]|nr:MAG: MFS transporter [Actinomycetota bacterium]